MKIVDLAEAVAPGAKTYEMGIRPGEKLHEELWTDGETVGPTSHSKILRAARPPIDVEWLEEELAELERMVERGDTLDVVVQEVDKERGRIGLKLVAKHEDGELVSPETLVERAKDAPPREPRPPRDDRGRGGRDRGRRRD